MEIPVAAPGRVREEAGFEEPHSRRRWPANGWCWCRAGSRAPCCGSNIRWYSYAMPANDRYLLFTEAAVPDHPAWPEVAHPERRSHGPVLVAAVLSPSPGKYPRSVSDFVLGVDRRVRLVAARASLLTSVYRPFRRDRGRAEP